MSRRISRDNIIRLRDNIKINGNDIQLNVSVVDPFNDECNTPPIKINDQEIKSLSPTEYHMLIDTNQHDPKVYTVNISLMNHQSFKLINDYVSNIEDYKISLPASELDNGFIISSRHTGTDTNLLFENLKRTLDRFNVEHTFKGKIAFTIYFKDTKEYHKLLISDKYFKELCNRPEIFYYFSDSFIESLYEL